MNLLYDGAKVGFAPTSWRFGHAELDERQARLTVSGKTVPLDRSARELLTCLLRNAGKIVTKDELMRAGWPQRVVSENSLAKAIGRIRNALDDADGECLRVVPGYGYQLVAEVECVEAIDAVRDTSATDLPSDRPESATAGHAAMPLPVRSRWRLVIILTVLLAAAVVAVVGLRQRYTQAHVTMHDPGSPNALASIAVLPFVDLSLEHDQRAFSDGLADQLLNDLSRVPQLHLASRTSSFAYRDQNLDLRTIAEKLNVATVLEGSVRKSAERIRVTVQLINAADGYHIWSETYDRPVAELFAMQDEITRAIVSALRIELLPEQLRGLAQRGTDNPDAYQEYLVARAVFQDDETAHRRAIAHFERAVQLDPKFIQAWLELADLLSFSGMYADDADEALAGKKRAMEIIDRVIALAPDRADAYFLRADRKYAHWWDWRGAEQDLERGAQLSSRDNEAYLLRKCRLDAALGRLPEAIAAAQRATRISASSGAAWTVMGYYFTAQGNFARAREVLAQAVRNQPLDEHAHYYLGLGELLQGHAAAALPHFEDSAHVLRLTGLALAHHSLGDAAASERELQLLIERYGHILPYQAAEVYAWRGENDKAFQWLERSYELHDASFMYLTFDPLLRNVHADPRYRQLLTRIGLPVPTDAIATR